MSSSEEKEIRDLIEAYYRWLRDETTLRTLKGVVEITTPFLDRHNDYIQLYVVKKGKGRYLLTDGGETLANLELEGLNLYTPKRRELLNSILRSFGVKLGGEHALEVEVDEDSFIRGKHNLIQAILHVNNLFMLASSTVQGIFYEDVRSWLDEYRIRYIEGVKFTGKSSFEHRLDFAIPRSEGAPERYLRVINTVNKQNVSNFIFTWEDIKEGRPPNAKAYAFLNDTQKRINPSLKIALSKYEIIPVLWSEKEEVLAEIAA